jgi:hypothetical protein
MEQFGVENLKKVVQFGAKLGEGVADILEDGKVELGEAAALLPTLMEVPGILANKDKIKQEAADLSDDERAELKEVFATEFDPADDALEDKVEKSINAAVAVLDLIDAFKKNQ